MYMRIYTYGYVYICTHIDILLYICLEQFVQHEVDTAQPNENVHSA